MSSQGKTTMLDDFELSLRPAWPFLRHYVLREVCITEQASISVAYKAYTSIYFFKWR